MSVKLSVVGSQVTTRPVGLRLPFRYGIVTLREAQEVQVRVDVEGEDGRTSAGFAAELLAPKWFDKTPELSNDDNVQQLLRSVELALKAYGDDTEFRSSFDLHAAHDADHRQRCAAEGLNGLVAGFGNAVVDKAVISALCGLLDSSFFDIIGTNAIGLKCSAAPDLAAFDLGAFLAGLQPSSSVLARHTVGLVDAIYESEVAPEGRLDDGMPESLEGAIGQWGLRAFKIKVGGDKAADIDRLSHIASLLDRIEQPYLCTLDGNEQYESAEAFLDFLKAVEAEPSVKRLLGSIALIEQPIARGAALSTPLGELGDRYPVEIDESDDHIDAFLKARDLGYRGVSSKSCKGVYRTLLNAARVTQWNAEASNVRYFVSAEDLSTQPGLAVQQDLSLVALLGCRHVERNGHFYGDGVAGLPNEVRQRLQTALPGLYQTNENALRLRIEEGAVDLTSLRQPQGYGSFS